MVVVVTAVVMAVVMALVVALVMAVVAVGGDGGGRRRHPIWLLEWVVTWHVLRFWLGQGKPRGHPPHAPTEALGQGGGAR